MEETLSSQFGRILPLQNAAAISLSTITNLLVATMMMALLRDVLLITSWTWMRARSPLSFALTHAGSEDTLMLAPRMVVS